MQQLQGLVIFAKVVECGSFSQAAQQLQLAKSSVSKHIARLEAELGVRLIQRSTRQLHITEEGLVVYQRCRNIVREIEQAKADASHFHQLPQGTLRISAPPLFGSVLLAKLIPAFQQQHPGLQVDLYLTENYSALIAEGYDASIRLGDLQDSSLVAQALCRINLTVVAAPSYLQQHPAPQQPQQLSEHHCLLWQPEGKAARNQWQFSQHHSTQTVILGKHFCSNDWQAIKQSCIAGAGIARISSFAVAEEIASGQLQPLLTEYQMPSFPITVVYPQRKHIPAKTVAFISYIRNAFMQADIAALLAS